MKAGLLARRLRSRVFCGKEELLCKRTLKKYGKSRIGWNSITSNNLTSSKSIWKIQLWCICSNTDRKYWLIKNHVSKQMNIFLLKHCCVECHADILSELRGREGSLRFVGGFLTGCGGNVYRLCFQLEPLLASLMMLADVADRNECFPPDVSHARLSGWPCTVLQRRSSVNCCRACVRRVVKAAQTRKQLVARRSRSPQH